MAHSYQFLMIWPLQRVKLNIRYHRAFVYNPEVHTVLAYLTSIEVHEFICITTFLIYWLSVCSNCCDNGKERRGNKSYKN